MISNNLFEMFQGVLSINIAEAKDLDMMAPEIINSETQRHPYNSDKPMNSYVSISTIIN
jgi:hypothetical protein